MALNTMSKRKQYVDHPRYGRFPRTTELDPDPNVSLHWNATSPRESAQRCQALTGQQWPYGDGDLSGYANDIKRIPNTAIAADLTRQTIATVPVTHYFDIECKCRDCGRPFIFFAEEQKNWYEELGFGLESDCVRCVPCRKKQQGFARARQRYEELFHATDRSTKDNFEMAGCCLTLIEAGVFGKRQTQRARMLLNRIPVDRDAKLDPRYNELLSRIVAIEHADDGEQFDARERENVL